MVTSLSPYFCLFTFRKCRVCLHELNGMFNLCDIGHIVCHSKCLFALYNPMHKLNRNDSLFTFYECRICLLVYYRYYCIATDIIKLVFCEMKGGGVYLGGGGGLWRLTLNGRLETEYC